MYVNPTPASEHVSLEVTVPLPQAAQKDVDSPSPTTACLALPIELRWGIDTNQQESVWGMHERSFPVKYDSSYYRELFAHQSECKLLSLCAYTTPSAYLAASRAHRRAFEDAVSTAVTEEAEDAILSKLTLNGRVEYSRPPMPPFTARTGEEMEAEVRRKGEIAELLLELEYIEQRRIGKENQRTDSATRTTSEQDDGAEIPTPAEHYSVLIGFAIGTIGYAVQRSSPPSKSPSGAKSTAASETATSPPPCRYLIATNPTGYLGSFAVDLYVRRHGVGALLLDRFLHYITTQIAVRASLFLHYTKEGMVALLRRTRPELFSSEKDLAALEVQLAAERERQELDRIAIECGMSPDPPPVPSLWQAACQLCPPLYHLYEDRCARKVLREKYHLTEAQITDARLFAKNGINWVQSSNFADRARAEMAALASELDPVLQHGVGEVWLHCNVRDEAVTQYYLKRGFSLHSVVPNFYEFDGAKVDGNLLLYRPPSESTKTTSESAAPPAGVKLTTLAESRQAHAPPRHTAAAAPTTDGDTVDDDPAATVAHKKDDDVAKPTDVASLSEAPTRPVREAHPPMRWLLPSGYDRVVNIDIRSVEACRSIYVRQSASLRRGGSGEASRWSKALSWVKEVGLLINAVALLVYVCFVAYRFSQTGRLV